MATYYGYNFPFLSETTVLPPQSDERLIKNDLKQLLLTRPGERVMRPDYGTIIRETVFDLNDFRTLTRLQDSIRQAIEQFEPRVSLRDVKINSNPDKGLIEIIVLVSLTRDPNRVLSVDVSLVNPITVSPTSPQVL